MYDKTQEIIGIEHVNKMAKFDREYQAQKVAEAAKREQARLEKRDWIDGVLDVAELIHNHFARRR